MTYSKFKDINIILTKAEKCLGGIEKEYDTSLHNHSISDEFLVEIKDFLGNLRSSLDYLRKKVSTHNFPICDSEKDFENKTQDLSDEIKSVMKKWQPFNNRWLGIFNKINNEFKHVGLIPQKRTENRQVNVSSPGGGSVSWGSGVTFGSGVSVMGVSIDPVTQMPIPNNTVNTEVIIWVGFEFEHEKIPNGISVLPFLKDSLDNIKQIISEIEQLI